MAHAMQTIAESGSRPFTKQEIPAQGTDARMQGNLLASEVLAYAQLQSKGWRDYAVRLILGTTDMRAAFMAAIKASLAEMRKVNAEAGAALDKTGKADPSKNDNKQAAKRVSSATVEVSKLNTVANAFNAAATIEGLCEYAAASMRTSGATLDDIGYEVIVEYARTFSDAKMGRKADPFAVKLTKWLDKNPPAEGDELGAALHAMAVKLTAEVLAKQQQVI